MSKPLSFLSSPNFLLFQAPRKVRDLETRSFPTSPPVTRSSISAGPSMTTTSLTLKVSTIFIKYTAAGSGDVNPIRDLEIISDELFAKDLQFIDGPLKKAETLFVRANDKTKKIEFDCLTRVKGLLEAKKPIRLEQWNEKEIEVLNKNLFLTAKPIVYLVNLSENDYMRKVGFFLETLCWK